MIQVGTKITVVDNSGAKTVSCIKVLAGYKKRYAKIGDTILVTVREIRSKRRLSSKIKKGEIYIGLIVKTKTFKPSFSGDNFSFLENSVVLLNKQNKILGTRVLGLIPRVFRYTKYLKVVALSSGVLV